MARLSVLDPVGFGAITDEDSDESSGRLEPHSELVDAALRLPEGLDSKFDSLHEVLDQLHSQCRRALVFTFSRPTLSYLAEATVLLLLQTQAKRRPSIRKGAFPIIIAKPPAAASQPSRIDMP